MGRVAALAMLGRDVSIAKEHGTIIEKDGRKYLLAYHPAAQLYSPKVREELKKDFKILKKMLKGSPYVLQKIYTNVAKCYSGA